MRNEPDFEAYRKLREQWEQELEKLLAEIEAIDIEYNLMEVEAWQSY